jgi:very-short-patch-repair endonuclease
MNKPGGMFFTTEDLKKRGLIFDGHSLPYNPNLIEFAREMRKNMTIAEKKLWYKFLQKHQCKFYRQRPIDHFIADFYCSDAKLIIEIDGSQHYTDDGLKIDAIRSEILKLYGLEIVRFTNRDVMENFDSVCSQISRVTPQSRCDRDSSPIMGANTNTNE